MNKKNRFKKIKINSNTKKESKGFPENKWVAIGLIILATFAVYYNSLNAPFIFDDILKIAENPDIKRLSNIKTRLIYPYDKEYHNFKRNDPSRPLTYLTFILNYYFGELNPFGYHLFNILIHIFNAILIFFLTRKIVLYTYKKSSNLFPLFVALFFAVHPVNTSVVTYIFSRSDILATFFYILSLLFFIKTFENNKKLYIFSALCFILSLFSKQTAVTLPVIVLLFDYVFLSDLKIGEIKSKKYYHIPFWIILLSYLAFRYFYFGRIGDIEAGATWNRYAYLIIQPYIILKYLKLLIIPIGLCIDHSIRLADLFEFKILASFFLIIGIFIASYRIYRKRTDISKIVLFCTLWFFIVLSPTSSFFPTTSALVENRLYLSGLGFYLLMILIYSLLFNKGSFYIWRFNWLLFILMVIHVCALGIVTVKRNQVYQDHVLLWQDVISKYPKEARAHNNLGFLYYGQKEYTKAFQEYQKALEINPDSVDVHNNLGVLYKNQKEYAKAMQEFQKALKINPYFAKAHYNLALLYCEQKEYTKAIQEYKKALKINPDYVEAHYNLALLYCEQKEYTKAIQEYKKALKIDPDYVKAHNNLGALYYYQKDYKKALQEFEYLLKLNPDDKNTKAKIKMVKGLIK